ncbi:helix-turn-helix domain-containing protein [Streptomyces rapamycinicus NRRL 5491]|uniref:helix-turn-helix domain-containing protein n=1 Tax=Streptomyces rapamycinicus TaxID=1226757 RepID=UPI000EF83712|nr:helix-turn-helix transcriptional regulator [Streptomyces rapamycinicus]UTO67930.1 helix-turn-helix domain-containing protein [Streptomyces rapamycinicus]UTP37121.1 helix-turn-helix domain-containing protein [Streptomyces rapamycinicus NRRL 5491]
MEEFAELLRELRGRTNRRYAALAACGGVSASALHRYCSGASVPGDYEVLARFGKVCGADGEELLELHRRWVLADAEHKRAVPRAPAAVSVGRAGAAGSAAEDVSRVGTAGGPDAETGAERGPAWPRNRSRKPSRSPCALLRTRTKTRTRTRTRTCFIGSGFRRDGLLGSVGCGFRLAPSAHLSSGAAGWGARRVAGRRAGGCGRRWRHPRPGAGGSAGQREGLGYSFRKRLTN